MNRKNSTDEIPSIIQEIVFYDKPNIKTVVPESILPKQSPLPVGKDIVISRKTYISKKNTKKHQTDKSNVPETDNKGSTASVEKGSSKEVKLRQSKELASIDSLNHFITYENLGEEESLEPGSSKRSVGTKRTDNKLEDIPVKDKLGKSPEKATRSPKKVSKSEEYNKQSKEEEKVQTTWIKAKKNDQDSAKITKKAIPSKVEESTFKTPKRPVKTLDKISSQKVTMLNYLIKQTKEGKPVEKKIIGAKVISIKGPKDKPITKKCSVEVVANERSPKKTIVKGDLAKAQQISGNVEKGTPKNSSGAKKNTSSPKKKELEVKRSRGRPRKSLVQGNKTESHCSDEDVSFSSPEKNKNYAELTNVPLNSKQNKSLETEVILDPEDLEEILEETQQHTREMDRVEKDLQTMFTDRQEEESERTDKGKRKASGRKRREVIKRMKKEVVEGGEEEDGEGDSLENVAVEDYDTEEDSRGEWIPLEYAEYRQQHVMKHQPKTYPCKFCSQKFSSYYSMRKHRALAHDDVGKDRKEGSYKESVKCKQEKEQDESDEESREEWLPQDYADYKLKHKMNQYQTKRVQWYKCKICCAVFSNYYKLSKHRIEHENKPNPYECKQCDDRFKDVDSLMAHIRVHQGKDPYQCRKCEKGFMTKAELDEHTPLHILKKGPSPPKRYRCDICGKEFSKLCDIERHTRVHTGEKPAECNICHKRFQQSHNLSKHLLTHLHVRPFQCEICNKKFGRIDVLNRHLLTHSMEKPFKCEICNKGFIRQIQVTNHVEKVHAPKAAGKVASAGFRQKEETVVLDEESADDPFEDSEDEVEAIV